MPISFLLSVLVWIAIIVPLPLGLFASFKTIEAIVEKTYYTKNKWMACAVISLSLAPAIWIILYITK